VLAAPLGTIQVNDRTIAEEDEPNSLQTTMTERNLRSRG
jgi:hypothetical protein